MLRWPIIFTRCIVHNATLKILHVTIGRTDEAKETCNKNLLQEFNISKH